MEDDNNTASKLIEIKEILQNENIIYFISDLINEKNDYKSRIEKAVEYINKHIEKCNIDGYEGKFNNFDIFTKPQKLLNILNGKE